MSDANNLVYICVHCGQVVENKDSDWHDRQCPAKHVNVDDDQEDIELNVEEVEEETPEETPEEKQVEKDDYVTRLINAVRIRTLLWDKYQKRDLAARLKLWHEIEQELGAQVGVPRRDWTNVREKYRTERSTLRKAAAKGRIQSPKWEYYKQLLFLEQDNEPITPKQILTKTTAPKVVSSKIVTVNGKKILTRNHVRQKPGPKPGSHRKASFSQKPMTRSRKHPKSSTHPQTINNTSDRSKLNELRVVVARNDYRDLTVKQNLNNRINDSNSRKRPTQSEVEAVSFKQVCIRNTEGNQMNSTNDDDTVGRFCSYLEVMLRTLPKEKQEVFYEETLDHLATLKRQIRRSNHSNPDNSYI